MVMFKSLFLAGLMFVLAKGDASSKPAMATLQVQPNFDFSLTRKEFRVHYSGLGDEFVHTTGDEVKIKIYGPDGNEFHTYKIDDSKKNEKKAYFFALDDAQNGEYKVEVCSGSFCSGKTPALNEIQNKEIQLTCSKGRKETNGDGYEIWIPTGEYSIAFQGPSLSDWITNPSEFDTIETSLNKLLKQYGSKTKYRTDFNKHGLKANPTYRHRGKLFYSAIKFNIARYKALFDKHRGENENRTEYAHDKCKRKYLLTANAHLVDTQTKEVKYRFKTTLHLSGPGKQYFILGQGADTRQVHVEMTHENVDIDEGSYKVHVIFCATDKDVIEATYCADPVIYDSDLTVNHQDE